MSAPPGVCARGIEHKCGDAVFNYDASGDMARDQWKEGGRDRPAEWVAIHGGPKCTARLAASQQLAEVHGALHGESYRWLYF